MFAKPTGSGVLLFGSLRHFFFFFTESLTTTHRVCVLVLDYASRSSPQFASCPWRSHGGGTARVCLACHAALPLETRKQLLAAPSRCRPVLNQRKRMNWRVFFSLQVIAGMCQQPSNLQDWGELWGDFSPQKLFSIFVGLFSITKHRISMIKNELMFFLYLPVRIFHLFFFQYNDRFLMCLSQDNHKRQMTLNRQSDNPRSSILCYYKSRPAM